MMTTRSVASALDTVKVGGPIVNPVDEILANPCIFSWEVHDDVAPYLVVCTRDAEHEGAQHVAEGDEETGVLAVHPWTKE